MGVGEECGDGGGVLVEVGGGAGKIIVWGVRWRVVGADGARVWWGVVWSIRHLRRV